MMRMFNRFYGLCAIAVCTILYTAWFLTGRSFGDVVPLAGKFKSANEFDHRLVVFGDSWSDNETDEVQGKVWTDYLCDMVCLLPLCYVYWPGTLPCEKRMRQRRRKSLV